MPELPEVETVVRALRESDLIGSKVKFIEVRIAKHIKEIEQEEFSRRLLGKKLERIERKGKWIIFFFEGEVLFSHLRMTGKYFVNESIRNWSVLIKFSNEKNLLYHDSRGFGIFYLRKIEKFKQSFPYISVGPDPVVDNISENYLLENLRRTNQPIKHLLLDQKIISGIGNIYVSEILFCSKVNPNKLSKEVSLDECREIIKNSKLIMKDAIESKGTSVVDFRSPFGRGSYQKKLRVYMREKEKCYDCGSFITMKKIKERSSFFCPECQK